MKGAPPPEKNSTQWRKNEKIINSTPALKQARDIAEGFSGRGSTATGGWAPSQAYKDNYDAIFGKKDKKDTE
jgi:hypothetical protein